MNCLLNEGRPKIANKNRRSKDLTKSIYKVVLRNQPSIDANGLF